jgi:hypothetical protein
LHWQQSHSVQQLVLVVSTTKLSWVVPVFLTGVALSAVLALGSV